MSTDKSKAQAPKPSTAKTPPTTPVPVVPIKVPPMFRKMDWIALLITFGAVWAVYLWTLAPNLTLEDSGELCTGAYYAGIPHPPGYPFWSIYAYFWTVIVPFGNVAWRVEVGQSFAAAMGCGLLALMVSRGGSMMIEGIEELKTINRRWENSICIVSGVVAGLLLGLGGFMWKESVVINRISLFGVPWLLAMIALLMRWAYAPQQKRYLYLAMLIYGWCATIHQSLILSAIGVEFLIILASPRLGRDMLLLGNCLVYGIIVCFIAAGNIPALNAMTNTEKIIFHLVGLLSIAACGWLIAKTQKMLTEWKTVILMGIMWVFGILVYFYEPVSGMTDPPMQWGYPRTVEGFFHALSRGQYGTGEGTNLLQDPSRFVYQLWYLAQGLAESFSWVYLFVGLIPFLFLMKMHKRERAWIIGLASIYFCLAVQLVIVLNVSPDRSTSELNKVFFTASHAVFAMMIGYGLVILTAYVATHYEKLRRWCFVGGAVAAVLAVYCLVDAIGKLFFGQAGQLKISWLPSWSGWDFLAFGPNGQFTVSEIFHWIAQAFTKDQYGLPVFANLILIALTVIFIIAILVYRKRGPVFILLAIFVIAPLCSGMSHWYKSEQRNHWFGYWFGHDMFTPPFTDPKTGQLSYDNDLRNQLLKDSANARLIYPEMARNTILFGGTDPGRFCPTYIIFCESFIPHWCQPEQDQKFDRRDVYIITQNALADGTYLDYLRAQYNRSKQIDPPFFSELLKQWWWAFVCPPIALSLIWIVGEFIVKAPNRKRNAIVIISIWSVIFVIVLFHGAGISVKGLSKTAYNILDVPFTKWGAHVEKKRRAEGVYPPNEIYIPSEEDSRNSFSDYMQDAQQRMMHDQQFPNEPRQIRPGEDVHNDNGRVQVSGQTAVMMINGLLCKTIFDQNPTNEFYVEESFPLDWMYNYETPFGVIMKINRQPVTELSESVFKLDHEFWSKYSARLCGDWITYDTSVQQIADFVERTYIKNNYQGFIGDRKFIRDEDAQKAFSKLRSSQAGMYAWRVGPQCPPEYRQKSEETQKALIRETDFAFKQAFAFCPYSPEAVYRYVNFLLQLGRLDDAAIIAKTCVKLDPYNDQIKGLINQLEEFKKQTAQRTQMQGQVEQMEAEARAHPTNFQNIFGLASYYMQIQQTNRVIELFDHMLASPGVTPNEINAIAQFYAQIKDMARLEATLEKYVLALPDQPEPRYDLAALQAMTGKTDASFKNLRAALAMSTARLKTNAAATDLMGKARDDWRFNSLRTSAEFQKLILLN
jgi:thioredoxin-like negative regulator of GroEL